MSKDTVAWLIVRGTGVYFLVHAFLTGSSALLQASMVFMMNRDGLPPETSYEIARTQLYAVFQGIEAAVALAIAFYLLRRGRTLQKLIVRGIPDAA